jgi:hypothetical protein
MTALELDFEQLAEPLRYSRQIGKVLANMEPQLAEVSGFIQQIYTMLDKIHRALPVEFSVQSVI